MYISIRETGCNYSKFINVDRVLNEDSSYKELSRVYKAIQNHVNSYESDATEKLRELNENFRKKIIHVVEQDNLLNGWMTIVIILFTLGIYYLILEKRKSDQLSQSEAIFDSINRHLDQMEESLKEKKTHKLEVIEEIKKLRKADKEEELKRLQADARIEKSLKRIEKSCRRLTTEHKIAIGHTLELQNCLKDEYFIINHGQNLDLMMINLVSRILKKHYEAQNYDHFQVLRHDAHLQHIDLDKQDVAWFQSQIGLMKTDHYFRRELICGDIFLESTARWESAIDFFSGRCNIAKGPGFMKNVLEQIVAYYFPNRETQKMLVQHLLSIAPAGIRSVGNLYSIAIPKEKFHEMCYLAKPFGYALDSEEYPEKVLEALQSGIILENVKSLPQVRVLSHKLTPENGVYIEASSTLSDDEIQKIEENIELLILRAKMQFKL